MTTTTTAPAVPERSAPPLGGFNLTFLGLEVRRMMRNKRTLFFVLGFPVILFAVIGGPQINHTLPGTGTKYGPFIMISMAVYGAMVSCTSGGAMVAVERALGWSRQLRLTPLRPAAYIATKIATAMTLGFVSVVVMLIVGFGFGVRMPLHIWVLSSLAAWLGSIVFAAFGLFMGYVLPAENAMQFLGPLLAVMAFFGGLFQPISTMGGALQTVAKFMPVYGIGQLARAPLTSTGDLGIAVLNIAVWLVLFAAGSAAMFRRDTKRV